MIEDFLAIASADDPEPETEIKDNISQTEMQSEVAVPGAEAEESDREVESDAEGDDHEAQSNITEITAAEGTSVELLKARAALIKAENERAKLEVQRKKEENEKRRLDLSEERGQRAAERLQYKREDREEKQRRREAVKQRAKEDKEQKAQQEQAEEESIDKRFNALLAFLEHCNDPRMPSSDAVYDAAHERNSDDLCRDMEELILTNLKPEKIHQIIEYWAAKHFPPIEKGSHAGEPKKTGEFKVMQKRIEHGPTAAEFARYIKREKFVVDLGEAEDGEPDEQTHLLYKPDVGFYRYSEAYGVWEKNSKELIASEVADLIPPHWNDRRICENTTDALAHIVTKDIDFDTNPIMTFKNGVLSLNDVVDKGSITSLELAKHDPEFYSTIGLDYDFDPNATCPMWDEYIEAVTNYNKARQAVLQEFCGYAFYADFPLHKALFLVGQGGDGNGSNGKSVFLDTIKAVLGGEKNVSAVDFSKYGDPQYLAKLEGKLLNISTEIKSNADDCETAFKAITAGDATMIKILFKNPRDVVLRAKCMHAINNFPRVNDLSDGMRRRMIFVEFERIFNDDPHGPLESKADKNLRKKLLTELPGIFNWCLRGYLELKKRQEIDPYFTFTESPDQNNLMTQLVNRNSILSEFIEDRKNDLNGRSISTTELFAIYERWAEDKKLHRMPRNAFSAKFKIAGMASGILQGGPQRSKGGVYFSIKYPE